ncbi:hypothetical protein CAEBREN_29019, partial [Caenorhabditis brenneri]
MNYCEKKGGSFFPGYRGKSLHFLCWIYYLTLDLNSSFLLHKVTVVVFVIIINILHIIILWQKSVEQSSIFRIMQYVALMDILSNLYYIEQEIDSFTDLLAPLCRSSGTNMTFTVLNIIFGAIRNYSRRCSTWLSFSIVLIRTLVLKYPMNSTISKLSNIKTANYVLLGVLIFCLPIQILECFKYEIIRNPNYESQSKLDVDCRVDNDNFVFKMHSYADGIVSKLIPCILFPVSTYFLMREIRKAEIRQKKMMSSSMQNNFGRTSKLVLYLTLTFFVAEFPLGIVFLLNPSVFDDEVFGPYAIVTSIEGILMLILSATTATHMIICVFMSSQYRETTLLVVRFGYPWKVK